MSVMDVQSVSRAPGEGSAATESATAQAEQRRFQLSGAVPSRLGMRFDPLLPFADWKELGKRLGVHANASLWWLGDWLAYGQYKYGRRYKQGLVLTGLDYQTLRNYAVVARRFELSRRRAKLSFQHHAEVCALADEQQDQWLYRAETERWSRNELRRRLRSELGRARDDGEPEPVVRLSVEPSRHERWLEAAERCKCELEVWMVRALDDAASEVLALS